MLIDLVIFDLDGTLIDSGSVIVDSVNRMLAELKLPVKPKDEIASYIGWGIKDLVKKSLDNENQGLFDRAYHLYWQDFSRRVVNESQLYPHVREVLEYLKDKRLAIMSNSLEAVVKAALKKHRIDPYFQAVLAGSDEACLKPMPCPLDKIIDNFAAQRNKCAIVGDMAVDVEAGKAAGIHTIAVTYGIGAIGDIAKSQPEYVIDNLLRLKDIIE